MRKLSLLAVVALLFSSCATILNSRYQKVTINTNKENVILVDGKEPITKDGKYLLERNMKPKQFTVKRKGYKDENFVAMQYHKSPLYILSCIPFGVFIYPLIMDNGVKAYDYDNQILDGDKLIPIPPKDNESKEIKLNEVSVNLNPTDIKYRSFYSYNNFKRNVNKLKAKPDKETEKINLKNTIFTELLNDVLAENGYIDTTNKVLKESYINNLLINANIKGYTLNYIYTNHSTSFDIIQSGITYIGLDIEWKVLDYYKKEIHTQTTHNSSGMFAITNYDNKDAVYEKALKDAVKCGLVEFINTPKTTALLHDKSDQNTEKGFGEIAISNTSKYASTIPEAIKSSVTIKNKNGHGSGFLISSDGYIVTNYHVVSDSSKFKVVLNDESEHDVEVIRVSKIYDLALLKIKTDNQIPLKISTSTNFDIASEIYAVGTPSAQDLSQTISKGIISGIRKTDTNSKLIQTDASVNAGNSGGAIISKDGMVLGVVSSKLKGFGIEGVAFGIPAYEIFDRLKIKIN